MKSLVHLFNRPLVARRTVLLASQFACFAAAIAVFALAVLKLSSLGLSEGDLIIGLLAAAACMMLMILIGLVLPSAAASGDPASR